MSSNYALHCYALHFPKRLLACVFNISKSIAERLDCDNLLLFLVFFVLEYSSRLWTSTWLRGSHRVLEHTAHAWYATACEGVRPVLEHSHDTCKFLNINRFFELNTWHATRVRCGRPQENCNVSSPLGLISTRRNSISRVAIVSI